jgi:hypothetical protein
LAIQEDTFLQSKNPEWKADQDVCIGDEIIYTPPTLTSGSVVANVHLYGNATKKSQLAAAYPTYFTHLFTENGSYAFNYSGFTHLYLINLTETKNIQAEVTRIEQQPEKPKPGGGRGTTIITTEESGEQIHATDIQLTVSTTRAGQTVKINKYFANAYAINR